MFTPEVLPFAEQLYEANVQRVLHAVDERLYPELVNQFRNGRFDSRHRFRDPSITLRRCRDDPSGLAGQCLSVGGQTLLLVVQILILRSVVNHRPEYDSSPADLSGLLRPADPPRETPASAHMMAAAAAGRAT